MSNKISRIVDTNTEWGKLKRAAGTVYANGEPVALHPSPVESHKNWKGPHKNSFTDAGSPTVYAESCPVVRETSPTTCGHPIKGGPSVNVYVP